MLLMFIIINYIYIYIINNNSTLPIFIKNNSVLLLENN
jgi:hypothetical protein